LVSKYLNDERIQIYDIENCGQYASSNIALDKCGGTYLYFMDSDDYLLPNALELVAKKADMENADICQFGYAFVNERGKVIKHNNCDHTHLKYEDENEIIKDAFFSKNIKGCLWSKFIRRSIVVDNGIRFVDGMIHCDGPFTMKISLFCRKVVFVNEILYYCLSREKSISRSIKPLTLIANDINHEDLKQFLIEKNVFEKYKAYWEVAYIRVMLFYLILTCYKIKSLKNYIDIFNCLKHSDYKTVSIGKSVKLASFKEYILYRMSLHPILFYYTMKLIKGLRYKFY
jgi:glycosyltransferase involved in cell wall biosynthesis